MEKYLFWGGALIAVTIWVVIDLIKNKGKSMPKLVMRGTLFIILFTWFIYLVNMGFPILSYFDNSAFIIIACITFLVMIGLFVAPYTNIKKGTPEYELIKGAIITITLLIVFLIYQVNIDLQQPSCCRSCFYKD